MSWAKWNQCAGPIKDRAVGPAVSIFMEPLWLLPAEISFYHTQGAVVHSFNSVYVRYRQKFSHSFHLSSLRCLNVFLKFPELCSVDSTQDRVRIFLWGMKSNIQIFCNEDKLCLIRDDASRLGWSSSCKQTKSSHRAAVYNLLCFTDQFHTGHLSRRPEGLRFSIKATFFNSYFLRL